MKICIDARYVRTTETSVQPSGGIGRYVYQLLTAMLEVDPELRLLLVVPEENGRPIVLGEHAHRVEERRFAPPPQSLRTLLAFPRDGFDADLFHFPANVLPLEAPTPAGDDGARSDVARPAEALRFLGDQAPRHRQLLPPRHRASRARLGTCSPSRTRRERLWSAASPTWLEESA